MGDGGDELRFYLLALADLGRHVVDGVDQLADLVPVVVLHLGAVAASGNALGGLRYLRHRLHHVVDENHVGHVHHPHAQLEDDDPQQLRRGVGIILKESRRLTNMVEELLDFSKMQDGRFTLNIEPVDIQAEFEDTIYTYMELFKQDNIELHYEGSDELFPPIPSDPERLKQVFCNVLDNALMNTMLDTYTIPTPTIRRPRATPTVMSSSLVTADMEVTYRMAPTIWSSRSRGAHTDMMCKIEITGLRKRWLVSSLSPIFVVALLIAGTFCVVMANYYYNMMLDGLR